MPYPLRSFEPGCFYALTARGNNRRDIVRDDVDRLAFVRLLGGVVRRYGLELDTWCLMTNHFHLLVQAGVADISRAMQHLIREHARRFNRRHGRSDHLFRARFRATFVVDDAHYYRTRDYILDNPIRAGLVDRREDWPWLGCAVGGPS